MQGRGRNILPGLGLPRRAKAIPRWLKLGYGLAVPVIAAVYWRSYGPQNYLWLSDIALACTTGAVFTGNRLLASLPAVGVAPVELAWSADFVAGGRLIGIAAYMFDDDLPLTLRGLSLFHLALPPTLIYLLYRFGYDRRAVIFQTFITWAAQLGAYMLAEPEENINWVFGPSEPQQVVPPLIYLGGMMALFPLLVIAPMHLLLKRIFPAPRASRSG